MSHKLGCAEVRELAAEVALGVVSGEERARVLEHVSGCSACRKDLEELARTADALFSLAPSAEPPAGFESRVLGALERARRPRRPQLSKLVAAMLAGALATATIAVLVTGDDRDLATHYRGALAVADGKYFGVRSLVGDDGVKEGHVFAYEGSPSWIVVVLDEANGSSEIELSTEEGQEFDLGAFKPGAPPLVWGGEIPVGVNDIATVTVRSPTGQALVARFEGDGS